MGRHWLRLGGHGSVHSPRLVIHCTPCANCTAVHSLMPTCPSLLAAVLRRPTLPRAARRACIPKTSMSTRERRGCMEGALLLLFQLLTGTLLVQLLLSPCKVQDHRSHLAAGMRRALRAAAAAMRLATSPERHAPLPDTIAKHNSMHSGCNKRQHTACYVIKEKRQLQAARRRCVALRCTPGTCTHRFWRTSSVQSWRPWLHTPSTEGWPGRPSGAASECCPSGPWRSSATGSESSCRSGAVAGGAHARWSQRPKAPPPPPPPTRPRNRAPYCCPAGLHPRLSVQWWCQPELSLSSRALGCSASSPGGQLGGRQRVGASGGGRCPPNFLATLGSLLVLLHSAYRCAVQAVPAARQAAKLLGVD